MCYYLIVKKILLVIVVIGIFVLSFYCINSFTKQNSTKTNNTQTLGVWWWDNRIDSSYLDFAKQNDVTEIYLYASSFNEKISTIIKNAQTKNIKVYWLAGKYEWIENYSLIETKLKEYLAFQKQYNNLFSGIHFDIEPHQHPEFETKREEILYKFIDLTYNLKQNYSNTYIEYDIPCWLDDIISYNGQNKKTFEYIIDNASAITLMSYRDSAQKIYDFAKDEINYAKSINKKINLGVETQDVDDDNVTFFEEGKTYLKQELNKLRNLIPKNYGIAIHYIESWYNLIN